MMLLFSFLFLRFISARGSSSGHPTQYGSPSTGFCLVVKLSQALPFVTVALASSALVCYYCFPSFQKQTRLQFLLNFHFSSACRLCEEQPLRCACAAKTELKQVLATVGRAAECLECSVVM